ncbi:6-carboxytetrahydropterin synthase [Modicisalibacter radicis]|uniref:6-carboxytetrahydropterin synthase n=1 Tax=Halomonas sp. EAR18 TaxID=2518972 RepID=UPI00109C7D5E|nr:6-carboxytetrahydropterin synthase [Halomonas sp. EAR18]
MTLFVNHISHVDVSFWCPQRGLSGASWGVDVELDGQLGADGMLFDFGEVKPWIKASLDNGPDHTLLVPTRAPGVTVTFQDEDCIVRTTQPYAMDVRGPRQAFTLLPWPAITAERLAALYGERLIQHPPRRVESVRLRFTEEAIEGAAYGYSHGLKRHGGNCQRIAHGHRSRLLIWCDGERRPSLERHWARRLDTRYLAHVEDILEQTDTRVTLGYRASQGEFRLTLPRERCELLPTATTVEQIAAWLAAQVSCHDAPDAHIRVQAFEGIDKGACAESPRPAPVTSEP